MVESFPEDKKLEIHGFLTSTINDINEILSQLFAWNWVDTTGASVSVRIPMAEKLFAMTPTHAGFRRWNIKNDGLVVLDSKLSLSEYSVSAYRAHPSAVVHNYIYENFELANAIIHTHSPYSLAFASLKRDIHPTTQQSQMLGIVPCLESEVDELADRGTRFIDAKEERFTSGMEGYDYALQHFDSLPAELLERLGGRQDELRRHGLAFTIYKHGVFILARNLDEAFDNLIRVERNCQVQIYSSVLKNNS